MLLRTQNIQHANTSHDKWPQLELPHTFILSPIILIVLGLESFMESLTPPGSQPAVGWRGDISFHRSPFPVGRKGQGGPAIVCSLEPDSSPSALGGSRW